MHFFQKGKKYGGKKKFIMMKVNIYKAYDKIERSFIEKMLFALVSSKKWTKLVAECITTFAFSEKIKGQIKGYIQPYRGLTRGDPLSLYLFIPCAKELPSIIHNACKVQYIEDIQMTRHCPPLSQFYLFANDSFAFGQAARDEAVKQPCTKH